MAKFTMTEQEVIEKLEEIAGDDRNRTAQISALWKLRELMKGGVPDGKFADLYDVADPGRGRKAS